MALNRTAYDSLLAWKNRPGHRALLVTGARQVGKTYLIREFARQSYESVLEINFIETPSACRIFEGDLDADTIITGLTAFSGIPLTPGRTLIFLDEIQECPRARTAVKFLVDDGRFDYVESGSLLGVSYKEVPSLPVGYEETLRMYPLTLEEFLLACGTQPEVIELLRSHLDDEKPLDAAIHDRLLRLFRIYLIVGGMPAAVQEYVETHDLARVLSIQRDVLGLYRQDIARYASDKPHVHRIFDAMPAELDKRNKRFKLSDLSKTARMERYESDFMWLADAGVALPCYNTSAPSVPLTINAQRNLFKLFLCDVGLLSAATTGPVQFELLQGDLSINWGSFLENVIAQQLAAHGFDLFYYDRPKVGEVDFLLQRGRQVIPLEAKSGADYRRHRSLDNLMSVEEWNLTEGIVLCQGNVERNGSVLYLPWYMLAIIEQKSSPASLVVDP